VTNDAYGSPSLARLARVPTLVVAAGRHRESASVIESVNTVVNEGGFQ